MIIEEVSYISIWIYIAIGAIFFALANKSCFSEKRFYYSQIAFLVIYFFAFFRFNIGNDYPTYWDLVTVNTLNRNDFEPLSGGIINLVRFINFPPLVFITFSTISLFSYRYVINEYSEDPVMSWYFYFTYPMLFFQDCSTIRQAGAMGCFFLAFLFVDKGRMWKAVLCIIAAVLFHKSALICFLILFLPLFKKVSLKLNVVIFVCTFFIGELVETIVTNYLSGLSIAANFLYYVKQEMGGLDTFKYLMFLINIGNFLSYKYLLKENDRNFYFVTLVNVGLCLFNLFQIESQTAIRFANFFMLFEMFLIPSYLNLLSRYLGTRQRANLLVVSCLMILQLSIVVIYIKAYNNGVLDRAVYTPYEVWLNHLQL